MSIFKMSERTKKNLSTCVGVPFEHIISLSLEDEIGLASKKYGKKIAFSKKRNSGFVGRGNPLLARKKIRTIQDVEKKIARVR